MKLAAVHAIALLAQEPPSDVVAKAYGGQSRLYGKDSLIPSPFDPRLILRIAPAGGEGGDGLGRRAQADHPTSTPTRTSSRASCSAPASS